MSPVIEKLMRLARSDIDLVQAAIRASARMNNGTARLGDVVDYIMKHRRRAA